MQYIRCPVCKSESDNKEMERYREYTLYWCTACDLQWWHPMYNPGAGSYEEVLRDVFSLTDELRWEHWQFFRHLPARKGGLLDIGCGTGRFLHEIKRRGLALQTSGLDLDGKAVKVARNSFGLNDVYNISLEEFCAKNPGKGFDIVTFFQVLEHQCDPVGFLAKVRGLLMPGCYIVLGVPNRHTWGNPVYSDQPPIHFTRWSTNALRFFLEKQGFSVVLIKESPVTFFEARELISSRINLLRHLEDTTVQKFEKVAVEHKGLEAHPAFKKLTKTGLSTLRLLKRGVLFTPSLCLSTIGRASSKKGRWLFCIAKEGTS